jgi:hypothetical protein
MAVAVRAARDAVLHLYCIRASGDAPPPEGLAGVDGEPVTRVVEGGLAAWVSVAPGGGVTPERIRTHDAVLREALRTATPLPARYRGAVAGEAELRESLRARAAEWTDALARLAGRVEMGIAVPLAAEAPADASAAAPVGDPGPPASGREYLARRRAEADARDGVRGAAEARLAKVEQCVGEVPWPAARTVVGARGVAGTLAYLVPRAEVAEFRRRTAALAACTGEPRPLVTGPWAPYSFV